MKDMTVGRWLSDRAEVTPGRIAIEFEGESITYAELEAAARGLAAEMVDLGLAPGDRVAVLSENRPEYVVVVFACAKVGLIVVPLNWRLAASELAYQLNDAAAGLLLVEAGRMSQAEEAVAQAGGHLPVRPLDRPFGSSEWRGDGPENDDPLFLIYTSGTTGRPKGALLSHANTFWTNLSLDRLIDVTTFDRVLQVLPQFHIGGWNVQPLLAWWKGATVFLERSFDPGRALRIIEEKRITTMMGVPATYLFMSERPEFGRTDLSSLRLAVVGGAPMPEGLIRVWHERGVQLVQGYGLTEAAPNVLGLPPEDITRKIGYAGKPYPHVEVALRDLRSGRMIEGPGVGELLVRGPNVFSGYWRNPEATAEALAGGWLHTGDIAERDDEGFYRIRDRVKDMFISGGENVYPAEVESVLHDHPDVVEAAVVGVPDERWGEVGAAFVVLKPGLPEDPDGLIAFCRQRLASYKVPKHLRFVEALPRSGVNKVLKRELAAQFRKGEQ